MASFTVSGCEPNRSVSDRSIVTALHRKHAQGDVPLRPLAQVLRGQFDQFLSVKLMAVLAHFNCQREQSGCARSQLLYVVVRPIFITRTHRVNCPNCFGLERQLTKSCTLLLGRSDMHAIQ